MSCDDDAAYLSSVQSAQTINGKRTASEVPPVACLHILQTLLDVLMLFSLQIHMNIWIKPVLTLKKAPAFESFHSHLRTRTD